MAGYQNRIRADTPDPIAEERARRHRWGAKGRARVVHPDYGEVVVPCASKFAACRCAADVWHCDWFEIINAEVWRYDQ